MPRSMSSSYTSLFERRKKKKSIDWRKFEDACVVHPDLINVQNLRCLEDWRFPKFDLQGLIEPYKAIMSLIMAL